jgi:hypothetical protein
MGLNLLLQLFIKYTLAFMARFAFSDDKLLWISCALLVIVSPTWAQRCMIGNDWTDIHSAVKLLPLTNKPFAVLRE